MEFVYQGRKYEPLLKTVCDDGSTLILAFSKDNHWVVLRDQSLLAGGDAATVQKAALKYLEFSEQICRTSASGKAGSGSQTPR